MNDQQQHQQEDSHDFVDADVLFATAGAVIISARLVDADGKARDWGLVIARRHCRGQRVHRAALAEQARSVDWRCMPNASAWATGWHVEVRIDGLWHDAAELAADDQSYCATQTPPPTSSQPQA